MQTTCSQVLPSDHLSYRPRKFEEEKTSLLDIPARFVAFLVTTCLVEFSHIFHKGRDFILGSQ